MDTTLLIVLLGVVLLAIVALPGLFRRKQEDHDLAPPSSNAPAPRSPLITALEPGEARGLAGWLCAQASAQTGIDLARDPMALTRISEAAKKAQSDIDTHGRADVSLPYITADGSGPKHFQLTITRDQWDNARHLLIR